MLIEKFQLYGIRGVASIFLQSYLSCRTQYVQFKEGKADYQKILCGVPQGSILGPLLLILYVNDMYKVSKLLHFIIFADDTNIFYLEKDPIRLIKTLNIELNKLSDWFKVNKLSLNVEKSNFMAFGKRNVQLKPVKLNSTELVKVSVTKVLGVQIDEKFSWVQQVDAVKKKLSSAKGSMYELRNKVENCTLLTIYNTLILPHLSYCCEIWGNTYNCRINEIVLLQKRAVRIINNAGCRDHTTPLFKKYGILKFKDLVEFQLGILMYKASNKMLPTNIQK